MIIVNIIATITSIIIVIMCIDVDSHGDNDDDASHVDSFSLMPSPIHSSAG
jgi:hypothetical protein